MNTYKPFLIALTVIIACGCAEDHPRKAAAAKVAEERLEDTEGTSAIPFPKKYLGFYAGMPVDACTKKLESQHFTIDSRVQNLTENNGEPRIEASRGNLKVKAFVYDSKVSGIRFSGKKDAAFLNDVMEISQSFSGSYEGTVEVFRRGNLKTYVQPYRPYLGLYDTDLTDSLNYAVRNYEAWKLEIVQKKYE